MFTKGLASINPYIALGLGWVRRVQKFNWWQDSDSDDPVDARHWSFNLGLGVEFPMMRNKAYFGAEARFQYVMFNDENDIPQNGSMRTFWAKLRRRRRKASNES